MILPDCEVLVKQNLKPLADLDEREWERLCDGCALCCRQKIEDADTGEIEQTAIACRLLDTETCLCRDYKHRHEIVPDCAQLTPENVLTFTWLPTSCAYRLLAEGHELPDWHPLITGDPESTRRAGMSARNRVIGEDELSQNT